MLFSTFFLDISLLFASIFLYVLPIWEAYKKRKSGKLPRGPFISWRTLGTLSELYFNKSAYEWINALAKKQSTDISCIQLSNVHVAVVYSPDLAREFLHKHDAVFTSRSMTLAAEYASRGFRSMGLSPWGQQWKKMRKMFSSELMNPSRLNWLAEKRNQEVTNLLGKYSSKDKIWHSAFWTRYGGPEKEELEQLEAFFTMLDQLQAFNLSDYSPWLRHFDIGGHEEIVKNAMTILNKYHNPVIDSETNKI